MLLTTGEECGNSTAEWFDAAEGRYHWLVEFDRRGTEAVTYGLESSDWLNALQDAGYQVGSGSYSDIASLAHLGVCGVNIGVGYPLRAYQVLPCRSVRSPQSSPQVSSRSSASTRERDSLSPVGRADTNWRYDLNDYDDALSWWAEEERHQGEITNTRVRIYGLSDEDMPDL